MTKNKYIFQLCIFLDIISQISHIISVIILVVSFDIFSFSYPLLVLLRLYYSKIDCAICVQAQHIFISLYALLLQLLLLLDSVFSLILFYYHILLQFLFYYFTAFLLHFYIFLNLYSCTRLMFVFRS